MKKRGFLRKLAGVVLAAGVAVGALPFGASAASIGDFTDVSEKSWYYNAVEDAVKRGLFAGTSATTFSPEGSMTRGMFVTVLGRKAGVEESEYLRYRFDDVKVGEYFAPYVEWAATYGIVNGTSKTKFSPNAKITREQMAAILYRYAQVTENDTDFGGSFGAVMAYPDATRVSGYATEAMGWAVTKHVINGSDGKLLPQGTATRAQVAQVLYNCRDLLVKTAITADPILPPEKPVVTLSEEEKAALAPGQDPQAVIEQVVRSTDAQWDPSLAADQPSLTSSTYHGWDNKDAAEDILKTLNRTGAVRFYVTDWYENGYCIFKFAPPQTLVNGKAVTGENITEALWDLQEQFPEGMAEDNCGNLAMNIFQALFDRNDYDQIREKPGVFDHIRPGDLVRYAPTATTQHSVIVVEKYQDHVVVVEGNWNDTVHWGRTLTRSELENSRVFYRIYVY